MNNNSKGEKMPGKCPHCNEPLLSHIIERRNASGEEVIGSGSEGSETLICPNPDCIKAVGLTLHLKNGAPFHQKME